MKRCAGVEVEFFRGGNIFHIVDTLLASKHFGLRVSKHSFSQKFYLKKSIKFMFYCFLTMNELQNIKNLSIFKGKNVSRTKCFDAPRPKCFDPPIVYTTNTC